MELEKIKNKRVIECYKNLLKDLPPEKLEDKFKIGKHVVKARNILKHLKAGDRIGKIVSYAIKLHMVDHHSADQNEKVCKNKCEKEGKTVKNTTGIIVALLPTHPQSKRFDYTPIQKEFESIIREAVCNKPITLVCCKGEEATRNNLEIAINEYQPDFIYLTTITHGDIFKIWGEGSDVVLKVGDNFTKQICPNNHFHFVACSAGSFLGRWIVFNSAKYVHAYPGIYCINLSCPRPYVEASSTVDTELLKGKSHSYAHWQCKKMYREKAREQLCKNNCLDYLFLKLDGFQKTGYGPAAESTLFDRAIPSTTRTMYIENIKMSYEYERLGPFKKLRGRVTLTVIDEEGKPVPGATVAGIWSGNAVNRSKGNTDSLGKVTLYSDWYWSRTGKFTFTVENIEHKDMKYMPEKNKQTSGNIKVGFSW